MEYMDTITQETLLTVLIILAGPIAYFILFALLAKIQPSNNEQRLFRKGFVTDLVYWFVMPIFYTRLAQAFLVGIIALFFISESVSGKEPSYGLGLFVTLPFVVQFFIALFIRDFYQYWIHRLFHMQQMLWPFHSIHHSTTEMDWLSSARTHPVDGTALLVVVTVFVYLLGFSPEVFLLLGTLSTIYNQPGLDLRPLAVRFCKPCLSSLAPHVTGGRW
jgi:sterol desaturase/sphingolipid hydroxylase (fatty acid hydroxylase superfamily)